MLAVDVTVNALRLLDVGLGWTGGASEMLPEMEAEVVEEEEGGPLPG